MNLKKIINNKVIKYLFSRYLTYFFQFIASIFVAAKLGPYYFGIWGFFLLLINYFRIINFGISNATNILLVQFKEDTDKSNNIIKTSFLLLGGVSILISLLALYYKIFNFSLFEKYELGNYFYVICFIAILTHFNTLYMNIYRVKNSLFEVAFFQSIIPILTFLVVFIFDNKVLLNALLGACFIGNILSFAVFYINKKVPKGGVFKKAQAKEIINKGAYLFVYNLCFYLIIVSVRTLISYFYSVQEFGFFTFSFTLANSILLLLQALAFIIFPKVIDKLKNNNNSEVLKTIKEIRTSYVSIAFGLVFCANIFFPILISLMPKYKEALQALQLISLTIVLYTNSFGFGTYLMAQNKEKLLAKIAFASLTLNVSIAFVLIKVLNVSFSYVILATNISYLLFTFLCVLFGFKMLGIEKKQINIIWEFFPLRLLLPYTLAIGIVLFDYKNFVVLPFILFVILNKTSLGEIFIKMKVLINKPNVIDI